MIFSKVLIILLLLHILHHAYRFCPKDKSSIVTFIFSLFMQIWSWMLKRLKCTLSMTSKQRRIRESRSFTITMSRLFSWIRMWRLTWKSGENELDNHRNNAQPSKSSMGKSTFWGSQLWSCKSAVGKMPLTWGGTVENAQLNLNQTQNQNLNQNQNKQRIWCSSRLRKLTLVSFRSSLFKANMYSMH